VKKLIFLAALLACLTLLPATTFTSKSLLFSDSYMLRARGCDANYWNPALLNKEDGDIWIPVLNLGIFAGNNSIDVNLYNFVTSEEYLDDADNQRILYAIDERVALSVGGQVALFGFTMGNVALSSSVHVGAKAAFDEKYLELLLYGNGDGSEVFEFSREDNYAEALSYLDLTVGVGDIRLPLPESIPDIDLGFAVSALGGLGNTTTKNFEGRLSANLDGLTVHQDVTQLASAGGYGAKGLIGLHSEPVTNLHVGVTLDNILGFIKWGLVREEFSYHFAADSLYALDLLDGTEGLYTSSYEQMKADPFTTNIPMEMRLAAMFKTKQISLSADYIQGFGDSAEISRQGRFALGAELRPIPILSFFLGYGSPNDSYPWRTSLGIGLNFKVIEFGLGFQSIEQFYPGFSTKGLAVATYFNIRT
jgi:hypothetical protein